MRVPLRSIVRLFCAAAVLLSVAAAASSIGADESIELNEVTRGEVRIRKLHLVRPDLLHYPLSLEIVC